MRPNQQTSANPRPTAPVTQSFRSLAPMRRVPIRCMPRVVRQVAVTPLPGDLRALVASTPVPEIRLKPRR